MSNQDIDGRVPPQASTGAPATPGTLEQQLENEREARVQMRDRLRYTEALAAESHALREQMAQELQRVTADRDRLRTEAAAAASEPTAAGAATPKPAASRPTEPLFTPTMAPAPATFAADRPLKPPPARRKGPWAALAMLGVLAAAGAAAAWYKGSLTDEPPSRVAAAPAAAPVAPPIRATASSAQTTPPPAPAAASIAVATTAPPTGATPLPPVTPEAQLAAAPTAAGPALAGMPVRLRKALDGEGIASSVDVDAASGHVMVADPQADDALRQRTDMVIRAVYAGASLPEPQIEHRWLSPMRGAHETTVSADAATTPATPTPAVAATQDATTSSTHAAALRTGDHRKSTTEASLAEPQALTPVLPAGRITEACMQDIAGKTSGRRAALTSCMKHSCCSSSANHNSEECRAYDKAYPFACGG